MLGTRDATRPNTRGVVTSRRGPCYCVQPFDVAESALDGDIPSGLQILTTIAAGLAAAGAGRTLVRDADAEERQTPNPSSTDTLSCVVDLGKDGAPPGRNRIFLRPSVPRSELHVLQLRVPLGLLIEETTDHGGAVVVSGALPGFSALGAVEVGDVVRGVTAYAPVLAGAPMWRQVASGTPVGTTSARRCFFRVDDSTRYADVRDAVASHAPTRGGDGEVTLVVERAARRGAPLAPRAAPKRIPLKTLVMDDLGVRSDGP